MSTETVWCPSCGAEYTAGMTACGDCGVPLVAERPRSLHPVNVSTETVWCPSCGAEYTAGMTACGDCGVPLVAERPRSRHAVEDHGWGWYRDEVDRTIQRARRVARLLQQLAFYLGVLEVLAFLVVVIASFTSDDYEAGVIAVGAIIYLPIAIIIPTAVWAFGALIDVQATRLDLAILEAELEEDEDAG